VEAGLREGRLAEDHRLRDFLARVPDPLAQGAAAAEPPPQPAPEEIERDLAELRVDAMQTLARTQRSLIRQLDAFRRRVKKQRQRVERAERGRRWSRVRSGAARFLRQSRVER